MCDGPAPCSGCASLLSADSELSWEVYTKDPQYCEFITNSVLLADQSKAWLLHVVSFSHT